MTVDHDTIIDRYIIVIIKKNNIMLISEMVLIFFNLNSLMGVKQIERN